MVLKRPGSLVDALSPSMEETFYLSLIREAADGHPLLGNSSLLEHRDDRSIVTFFPLIPAFFMRVFHLDLSIALFLTDLLFPFLTTLFFFIAWKGLFRHALLAIFATIIAIGAWEGGLLNVVNPKMVMLLVAAYMALLFGPSQPSLLHFALRGVLIGVSFYTYPLYFPLFGAWEFCDVIRRVIGRKPVLRDLQELSTLALALIVTSLPYLLFSSFGTENPGGTDLWYRQVIPSFLPANPLLQFMLVVMIALSLFIGRKKTDSRLLASLAAGLLLLNQSLIHGLDIMFGLHYRLPLIMLLWIAGISCIRSFIKRSSLSLLLIGILAFFHLFSILKINGPILFQDRNQIAQAFQESDAPRVLKYLEGKEESVVLAPHELAEIIPVYTSNYVAWNGYANYQSVTDSELARRYVLQELVEPKAEALRDRTYPQVFSVHAGNAAARKRTWCRISSFLKKSEEDCRVDIRDFIRKQDALLELEEGLLNLSPELFLSLLQEFHVDIIVAKHSLPALITSECPEGERIGIYTLYECEAARSMILPMRFSHV